MALTDLTRISTSGIATGSTIDAPILRKDVNFRGDQVGVTSALFDSSEKELNLKDNVKLTFGDATNGDLRIYHDSSNGSSYIKEEGTGSLYIQGINVVLENPSGTNYFAGVSGAQSIIYYNGAPKITTSDTGATVTGTLSATAFSGGIIGGGGINAGIVTCTTLDVNGNGDISGNLVLGGNLTVNGTTTTLDTKLIDVDKIEVKTTGAIVGVAVTQSGSADLVRLYDDSTQVVTVDEIGRVGLGTVDPTAPLHLYKTSGTSLLKLENTNGTSQLDIRHTNGYGAVHYAYQGSEKWRAGQIGQFTDYSIYQSTGVASGESSFRFTVKNSGNVGVSTFEPRQILHVNKGVGTACVLVSSPTAPQIRFNPSATDGSDTNRTILGQATANGNFVSTAVVGDTVLRGTNTGNLLFGVGTSEKLRITSGGSVNIGGDYSQTSSKLKVTGTVTVDGGFALSAGSFTAPGGFSINSGNVIMHQYIAHDADPDSFFGFPAANRFKLELGGKKRLEIRSDGYVGIGTDNPQAEFEVYGHSSAANGAAPILAIRNGYSGTANSSNALKSELRFLHKNHNAAHEFMAVRILADTVDNYSQRTFLRFLVAKGNNGTERFTISPEGNIGIGTNTFDSSADLSITNDTSARIYLKSGNASDASIYFGRHNDSATAAIRYEHSDDALDFYGYNNARRIRIASGGSVLLNTTVDTEASADGNELIIGSTSNTHAGMSIVGSTSGGIGNIFFSDGASYKNQGIISYRHADDSMRFTVDQYEALRILADGEVRVNATKGTNNVPAHLRLHCGDVSIAASQAVGQIRFAGRDAGGTAVSRTGALIQGTAAATWDTTQTSGYAATQLDFFTQNNSGTDTVAAGARLRITSGGDTIPGADVTYDLGANTNNRWRNIYGQTLSLTSYATIGAIVVSDPGSSYYSYNNRIGGGLAVVGTSSLFGDVAVSSGNRLYFGNSDVAWVKGVHGGSGYLELGVNNAHVTLTRGGHLQLISGNLEFADGAGIDFSNSTLGGPDSDRTVTTDGNKLDDYEEGTFVPQLNGMGTVSYDLRAGRYTKIGNVVYFQLRVNLNSRTGGSHAHITNMPFTQSSDTIQYPHATFFAIEDVELSSNHHPVAQFINSEIYLYQVGYQSSSNYSNMDENQIKDSSQWGIFGFYYTAT